MPGRQGKEPAVRPSTREAQRRRTRLAIVQATQQLLRSGRTPSVDDVAAAAEVSRRTIYMYFPTLDQLVLDAAVGLLSTGEVEAAMAQAPAGDATLRVDALARAVLDAGPTTLPLGRQIIRLTIDDGAATGRRRGYRRVQWIESAIEPLRPELDAEQLERLTSALSLVIGWEAMTVLQDVCGLDAGTEAAVTRWAARALVEAMLAERDGAR